MNIRKAIIAISLLLSIAMDGNAQSARIIRVTKAFEGKEMTVSPGCYPYSTDNNSIFVALGQDGTEITEAQFRMFKTETWTAKQGHGYLIETRKAVVRAKPSSSAKIVGRIDGVIDGYPDCYECLGVSGSWYKIGNSSHIGNWTVGYVHKNAVSWSISHAESAGSIR